MRFLKKLLFLIVLYGSTAAAQEDSIISIQPGMDAKAVVRSAMYRYPHFMAGQVSFINGFSTKAQLNYNRFNGTMDYMDLKGDTLSITNITDIKKVCIGKDTFYFSDGFLEQLYGSNDIKLAARQILKIADKQKIGGLGLSSSTTNIESYESYYDGRKINELQINENLLMRLETIYYIGNQQQAFLRASKKNLIKLFPEHKKAIETYLKEHIVKFNESSDLKELVIFLQNL